MKKTALTTILLALAVGAPVLPTVLAHESGEQGEGQKEKIPDTIAGIWQEVQEHEEELGKIIAAQKLDQVHEVAFEIRDFVNALPDKSAALDAEKLGKVRANAKFVAALAARLDESGDAKDQALTEANFAKLQQILKTIKALYPPELLKGT